MQREHAGDQVEAGVAEWQPFRIGGNARRRCDGKKQSRGLGGNHLRGSGSLRERTGESAAARAEIERGRKFAPHQIEPVEQPVGNLGMQKIGEPSLALSKPRGAVAIEQLSLRDGCGRFGSHDARVPWRACLMPKLDAQA